MNNIDELQYIANNFSVLQSDYQKYAAINLVIKTKTGKLVRLLFNRMQKYLWSTYQRDRISGQPIRWYVVKGRQMGLTTWFLGLLYWLETMHTNTNSLLLAHDEPAARSLGLKIQYLHFRGKPQLTPEVRTMNREQIHFATSLEKLKATRQIGLDSVIDISTGDSDGIGISRTYQYVLITEFATMPNVGIDVPNMLAQLGQCVPREADTGVFIDTTAKGENYAKDFWDDESNGFRKIFISWVAEDTYRNNLPIGNYPELSSNPNAQYGDETEEFENIKRELIKWYPEQFGSNNLINTPNDLILTSSNERKSNNLMREIQLDHESYCRIAWRRDVLDTQFFGDYSERRAKFKQEYPTTAYDAFSASSGTIFPISRIIEREEQIKSDEVIPTLYEFNNQATKPENAFFQSNYGNIRIYEEPQSDIRYAIGGDVAQGIPGGDDSSLVVLKLPSLTEVASFNDVISPSEYASISHYLAKIYNNALLAIELNDKGGYASIQFLRDILRYPNLFYMPDQSPTSVRYGWVTNGITKSVMISDTKDLITNRQVNINSKELLSQLKVFVELKPNVFGAVPGKHDDLVMAFMIAIQCAKSIHIPRVYERPKKAPKGSPDYIIAQMSHRQRMRERFKRMR